MEYVQTVLVQIDAAKMNQASRPQGLLAALDEHRSFLQQLSGFQDMRVTRSINAEGNILIVVETRWGDDDSLVEYETREPNVMSIISSHEDVIIPDSLQVLDMEALRTEAWPRLAPSSTEAHERLALPLLLPLGVLAFALLVIYGLSRIYLEVPNDVATPLAAGIAVGILATAWYFATHPRVPGWQVGSVVVLAAGLLIGGAIYAIVQEDEAETAGVSQPTASPGASPGASPATGGLALQMGDNFFELEGKRNPTIPVSVGQEVSFSLTNGGVALHNMHVAGPDNEYGATICQTGGDEPCSDPNQVAAGETATLTITLDQPGSFKFRCDFHPIEMTGTLEAR